MSTTTGKQAAAAAAETLLADRIALVETLGAALDTHRRAEEAVTTARAAAAQHARDAYDTAQTGGWTAAELNKARPPRTGIRPDPQEQNHPTVAEDHRIRRTGRHRQRQGRGRLSMCQQGS